MKGKANAVASVRMMKERRSTGASRDVVMKIRRRKGKEEMCPRTSTLRQSVTLFIPLDRCTSDGVLTRMLGAFYVLPASTGLPVTWATPPLGSSVTADRVAGGERRGEHDRCDPALVRDRR